MGKNAIAYISIDGETYRITAGNHLASRAEEREGLDDSFVVNRLEYLLSRSDVADAILNGVRYGETFIIEDVAIGYDVVVAHYIDSVDTYPTLDAITLRSRLRIGDGQKILSVFKDRVELAVWHLANKRREIVEW